MESFYNELSINVLKEMPRRVKRLASRQAAEKITKIFASKKTTKCEKISVSRIYATKITETSKKTKKFNNMINNDQKLLMRCSVPLINILTYPGERADCTLKDFNLTMRAIYRCFKHKPNLNEMLAMTVDLNIQVIEN